MTATPDIRLAGHPCSATADDHHQPALPLQFSEHALWTVLDNMQRELVQVKTRLTDLEDLDIEMRLTDLEEAADYDDDDDDDYPPAPLCVDCGVDTCPVDRGFRGEFFMVHDEVWAAAGMGAGYLCVGCLEHRLGRQLTPGDFTACELNDLAVADGRYASSWRTPRLVARMSGQRGD
jgi:hypothetical protein